MKTILFLESAFCQTNQMQQDGARRYARAAGWQLRTIEYGRAARDRAGHRRLRQRSAVERRPYQNVGNLQQSHSFMVNGE